MSELEALISSYTVLLFLMLPILLGTMAVLTIKALLQLGQRWIMRKWRDHHPVCVPHRDTETT